jgi:hypothetical protein
LRNADLFAGTTVTFSGTTTFGYKEWDGPLVSVAGTNVHIQGSGILDGNGAKYWDGQGSNGGKSTPSVVPRVRSADGVTLQPSRSSSLRTT